jgi:hypothetical protein
MRVVPAPARVHLAGGQDEDMPSRMVARSLRSRFSRVCESRLRLFGKGPKLLSLGITIDRWVILSKRTPSPNGSRTATDSLCRSQDHDSAHLPMTATSFSSS